MTGISHCLDVSRTGRLSREKGYLLVQAVLIMTMLAALAAAFCTIVVKNARQSNFLNKRFELRRYAESGIDLALFELSKNVNGGDGNIGTETWKVGSDVGRDGRHGTHDEGELNGIPGPGEPGTLPVSVGPTDLGIRLLVRTSDTSWSDVKRIDAVAYNSDVTSNVRVYARVQPVGATALGAAYIEGGVKWNLSGSSYIRGHDTDPPTTPKGLDGPPGPMAPIPAIATSTGWESVFKTQLAKRAGQYTGLGSNPSVKEYPKPDFDSQFNNLVPLATRVLKPGSYSSVKWGDWLTNDYQVTYVKGDLSVSSGTIAGILLVDGKLTMNGPVRLAGMVMARKSAVFTGGSGGKIYGSLWTKAPVDFKMSGDAGIMYSSKALAAVAKLMGGSGDYAVLHWSYPK